MIKNKDDLKEYLECDKKALGITYDSPKLFTDEVWRYQIALRKREYYTNIRCSFVTKICRAYWTIIHHKMSIKLGIQVPPNVCGPGLNIHHWGLLVISQEAKIGKNFNVHQGVNIGVNLGPNDAPSIGDNVFCGPGVKMYGAITIADNIAIAAASVFTKSFTTPNITIGGVPAKIINSNKGNLYV